MPGSVKSRHGSLFLFRDCSAQQMPARGESAMSRVLFLIVLGCHLCLSSASAQAASIPSKRIPYQVACSPASNTGSAPLVCATHVVSRPGAQWLRVYFGEVHLGPCDFVRVVSHSDGARQDLSFSDLKRWGNSSAYFNGTIKKLAFFPKRLSDAELQEMTL